MRQAQRPRSYNPFTVGEHAAAGVIIYDNGIIVDLRRDFMLMSRHSKTFNKPTSAHDPESMLEQLRITSAL